MPLASVAERRRRGQTNLNRVELPEIKIARHVRHQPLESTTRSDGIIMITFSFYVAAARFVHPTRLHGYPRNNNYPG